MTCRRRSAWRTLVAAACVAAAALLAAATPAHAQVARSFLDLQQSLHGGERLTITDVSGVVTDGSLVALSGQSLRLKIHAAGNVDVPESNVARIERVTSPVKTGALVGLLVGAAGGALAVALTPPCKGFCIGPSKDAMVLPVAGLFGGIGAGVGALVGATRSARRVIYLAPDRPR